MTDIRICHICCTSKHFLPSQSPMTLKRMSSHSNVTNMSQTSAYTSPLSTNLSNPSTTSTACSWVDRELSFNQSSLHRGSPTVCHPEKLLPKVCFCIYSYIHPLLHYSLLLHCFSPSKGHMHSNTLVIQWWLGIVNIRMCTFMLILTTHTLCISYSALTAALLLFTYVCMYLLLHGYQHNGPAYVRRYHIVQHVSEGASNDAVNDFKGICRPYAKQCGSTCLHT